MVSSVALIGVGFGESVPERCNLQASILESIVLRKRFCLIAIVLVLGIYLFAPAFESVDHWDQGPISGNDIVLNLTAVVFCAAAVLAFAHLICTFFCVCGSFFVALPREKFEEHFLAISWSPFLLTSPPALRI
ncbi:MAG: hypothetical protein H0X25_15940 [Acidobacteriales bacterium]|nr:hypothetical protein [Terriglobales bacterium]